jgi:hypothetical protein
MRGIPHPLSMGRRRLSECFVTTRSAASPEGSRYRDRI